MHQSKYHVSAPRCTIGKAFPAILSGAVLPELASVRATSLSTPLPKQQLSYNHGFTLTSLSAISYRDLSLVCRTFHSLGKQWMPFGELSGNRGMREWTRLLKRLQKRL